MEWLRLRMANMKLEERVAREKDSIRRMGHVIAGDVILAGDDVLHTCDDITIATNTLPPNGVAPALNDIRSGGISCSDDAVQTAKDVTLAENSVTSTPSDVMPTLCDVTPAEEDASALETASVLSVCASPVPDDVTLVTDDVTASDVSGGTSSDDDAPPERLRERCRRQRRQLRGLKRRLAQLQRENAALRRRGDPATAEAAPDRLDPAAMVADITQAAAETAAQLAPSGLAYQPETGLYYDHDSGYYWDPTVQMYYDGSSGYYLRYDETSGGYTYLGPSDGPSGADPHRRHAPSGELEDGEIEDDDEDTAPPAHWTAEQYWTEQRMRQAVPEPAPDSSQYSVEPSAAVIQSGPRSPQASRQPPWLRMIVTQTQLDGLQLGSLHVATMDGLTIGRHPTQQLLLEDTNLSKFHAVIGYRMETNDFYIRDLGSRNGTFVDGRRISAAKQESEDTSLPHGCQLRLGCTFLVCHVHAANDTCLECEPGQAQRRLAPPAPPPPPPPSGDTRQQRRHVVNRIKQKYGLRAADGAAVGVAPGYADRAAERRLTKGSNHPAEKTQAADAQQAIPQNNKGFRLLQQMGWSEGSGLGRTGRGIVEPVTAAERGERRGLGCTEPAPPAASKADKRKTEVWQKTQERFSKLV